MSTKIWIGAGTLVVGGFTAKQLLWNRVSNSVIEARDKEHRQAHESLDKAQTAAKQFTLKPLSSSDREKLSHLHSADFSKFERRNEE